MATKKDELVEVTESVEAVEPVALEETQEPQEKKPRNFFALLATILGAASIFESLVADLLFLFPSVVSLMQYFPIAAIILGVVGLKKAKKENTGKGLAIAGIALGSAKLALDAIAMLLLPVFLALIIIGWMLVMMFLVPGGAEVIEEITRSLSF